jgi:hypothetical protein
MSFFSPGKSPALRSIVAHTGAHPFLSRSFPSLLGLISLLLWIAPLCAGAVAFDAAGWVAGTPAAMPAYTHTIGKGSSCVLFVGVKVATSVDVIGGVNYGSNAMTRLDYYRNYSRTSTTGVYLYFQAESCSSANTVHVVFGPGTPPGTLTTVASASYTGVVSALPANIAQGGMATPAFRTSLAQTAAGSWIIGFLDDQSSFEAANGSVFRAGSTITSILDNQQRCRLPSSTALRQTGRTSLRK